ncbi:MAG TPA: glycoside hydrolase family 3 N-terminal domain-containing protein, partial [Blastocatellia bacterium]|nr:glycoside hydrolase family 3 N-terminal domain-containing protein [Blastocatellia bacterium]
MKLEHRIGQLLLIGLPGPQLDLMTRSLLQTIQPGGVLLNKHNIESAQQVYELISAIRSLTEVPPIIAVDQEGGRVDRLKEIFSPMPSADLLRAAGDASIAARMGEIAAEALRTLGFNTNFAPVLDIAADDSAVNGLKGRYLGGTVAEVVRLGGAYLEGLKHGGVVGVGKHFPGLGNAIVDSHAELPTVDSSRDQIMRHEVAPYMELFTKINARLDAVIVAHAHYPALDGPAPL